MEAATQGSEPSRKAPSILLVEDSPLDASLLREALEEHALRCELFLVTDGALALEFVRRIETGQAPCPDLVILDINLPMASGLEVLGRMRASPKCQNLQTVILTSSDNQRDKKEASRLGVSRYLLKPLHLDEYLKLGGVFKSMLEAA